MIFDAGRSPVADSQNGADPERRKLADTDVLADAPRRNRTYNLIHQKSLAGAIARWGYAAYVALILLAALLFVGLERRLSHLGRRSAR